MSAKYIVIEVWENDDQYTRDELYDLIIESLGGGCAFSGSQDDLYYLMQRCAEDMNKVRVLAIGFPPDDEED